MTSESVELTPTRFASDGRAIARRDDGKVVFIAGALPGETVRAAVTRRHRSYDDATVEQVHQPATGRVAPPCPHVAEGCGGCQWQRIDIASQTRFKETMIADSLARIGGMRSPPLRPSVALPPWRDRTNLRVAISEGRPALRRGGSHDLVPVDGCLIVHPLLAPLVDSRGFGPARYANFRCGTRTGERLVDLSPSRARAELPAGVRRDHLHEEACGRVWRISARSFFQSRTDGLEVLADLVCRAADEMGTPSSASDLYSGVGVFAGVLADRGWRVTAVEGSATSAADAAVNLDGTGARVVHGDVRSVPPTAVDLVVADPSREGLGRDGVEVVDASGARRLVLISCDVASLGRDARLLQGAGFGLSSVTPVDMFPHTAHVEVVSVLDRA